VLVRNLLNVSCATSLKRVAILSYLGAYLHFSKELRASDSSKLGMLECLILTDIAFLNVIFLDINYEKIRCLVGEEEER